MAQRQENSTVKKLPKFSVVDFEFALIRDMLFIISGAVAENDSEDSDVTKFHGIPIHITEAGKSMNMSRRQQSIILKKLERTISKKRPDQFEAFKKEMEDGFNLGYTNLTRKIISGYFRSDKKDNIVALWNGYTDKMILGRLGIKNIVVNLDAYDEFNNGDFYLRLCTAVQKFPICKIYLGNIDKNGRLLSLKEAHDHVCSTKHVITYLHDPRTDVILTKCLLNYLISKEPYEEIMDSILIAEK